MLICDNQAKWVLCNVVFGNSMISVYVPHWMAFRDNNILVPNSPPGSLWRIEEVGEMIDLEELERRKSDFNNTLVKFPILGELKDYDSPS